MPVPTSGFQSWSYDGWGSWWQPWDVNPWGGWYLSSAWYNEITYTWLLGPWGRFGDLEWDTWTVVTYGGWDYWWSPWMGDWAFHQWWNNVWILETLYYSWSPLPASSWPASWYWSVSSDVWWFAASWDFWAFGSPWAGWVSWTGSWSDWGHAYWWASGLS